VEDAEDEPLLAGRAAGTGTGRAMVMATVRVPGRPGGRRQGEARELGTTRRELEALAAWLLSWQVQRAGTQATPDYWKPACFLLEKAGLDCTLYKASQVKALPGRPKTGRRDSVRLALITGRGSLQGSFVPPGDVRQLRACTRCRRHLAQARTAQRQRAEKLPEDARLKAPPVLPDIHGASGRAMLNAIIAGQRDPKALAQPARGLARRKPRQPEEAPDCTSPTGGHVFALRAMPRHTDQLTAETAGATTRTGEPRQPREDKTARLCTIPGLRDVSAHDLTAGTGADMSVLPAPGHLASRASQAPGASEPAGRRKARGAGHGNPCPGGTPGEAATSAGRTQAFPGARYRRLIRHMPKPKAQRAITRTQPVITWHTPSSPDPVCNDPGTDYHERQADTRRRARTHAMAPERPGYRVTTEPLRPGEDEGPPPVTKAS
jgi:transposase